MKSVLHGLGTTREGLPREVRSNLRDRSWDPDFPLDTQVASLVKGVQPTWAYSLIFTPLRNNLELIFDHHAGILVRERRR
jgi:hypothetical protein